ncbi:MAG TPA: DMT family transporter [Candidatus Omnitrophota bacterium]|nr:DMT family transporter [Candidatus Omnitrophota bacterium]
MARPDALALGLILLSAAIHPLWNMLLKKSDEKIVFYFNIHLFFTIAFGFTLFVFPVASVTAAGWGLVFLSSITHFLYQVYLCRTYDLGDLSLTYPIIRSAPLFVVIMGAVFLKERLSPLAVASIVIIVLGAQMINQKKISIKEFTRSWKHANGSVITAAVMTAFFSALYSVVDKKGVLLIHPVLFFYLFFAVSGLMFGLYVWLVPNRKVRYLEFTKTNAHKIALASLLEFASYVLILFAFRMTNVATVVAIRQISVVFGAMIGIFFLKEKYGKARIFASAVIFIGIYLLVISK